MENYPPDYVKNPAITGSHEEFWVLSSRSQWNCKWIFSDQKILKTVQDAIFEVRRIGMSCRCQPRVIHIAQLFLWRFYAKTNILENPPSLYIPIAFECAAQILEVDVPNECRRIDENRFSKFDVHFKLVSAIDFNLRVHHPSEYLTQFTGQSDNNDIAESIIADSFLIPTCLMYKPIVIAEGAAIMAAAMETYDYITPKNKECLPFIQDMKMFYKTKLK